MKIIVAPDSFKGSISAAQLCRAIKNGILQVFADSNIVELPLADGGEGTMETLVYATGGQTVEVSVQDPLGRPIVASYGVLGDGQTVVIELAQASGLTLLADSEKNPLLTTSYGTGQLIIHALDHGYRRFIIALGGSATNDAGAGLLQALGLVLEDAHGQPLAPGGAALKQLYRLDPTKLDPRLQESTFEVACDVTNPLCGPQGASAVFGPQKGASNEMVHILDEALAHFGEKLEQTIGIQVLDLPGGGAAGGTGVAMHAFLNARMRSGIDMVLELSGWDRHLSEADLVITGEGKLDEQTLSGKVIAGVCRSAQQYDVPVIALCGSLSLSASEINRLGLQAAFSISKGPVSLETAIQHAASWASAQTEQLMRVWRLANRNIS